MSEQTRHEPDSATASGALRQQRDGRRGRWCAARPVVVAAGVVAAVVAAVLVPAGPAAAACAGEGRALAQQLVVTLPSGVPVTPPQFAVSAVSQRGPGTDTATGTSNSLLVPVPAAGLTASSSTGTTGASATVAAAAAGAEARTEVERIDVAFATLRVIAVALRTTATAGVSDGSGPSATATVQSLRVNDTDVPLVPATVPVPGGVVELFPSARSTGAGQAEAFAAVARIRMDSGLVVLLGAASASARCA